MFRHKHESGSALTEFVVLMVVLVPLMFGIPMVGKMIDLKQTTTQASRYSAWETTVNTRRPTDVGERFYSDASSPIGKASEAPNALWGVHDEPDSTSAASNGDTQTSTRSPLIALSSIAADTSVQVDAASANVALPSAYSPDLHGANAHDGPAKAIGGLVKGLGIIANKTGGKWGTTDSRTIEGGFMNTDGLVRGEASAIMKGNGWMSDLTFTQGTVIMNDNWSVPDALAARDRVRTLVPAGALKPVGEFLGTIGQVPGLKELKYFKHDDARGVFGYVNMEPLPVSETGTLRPLKSYEGD